MGRMCTGHENEPLFFSSLSRAGGRLQGPRVARSAVPLSLSLAKIEGGGLVSWLHGCSSSSLRCVAVGDGEGSRGGADDDI